MYPKIFPLAETALTIEWGAHIDDKWHQQVINLNFLLQQKPFEGFLETVPAYSSLTVFYQAELIAATHAHPFLFVRNYVEELMQQATTGFYYPENIVAVPVCYEDEFGPDLHFVAKARGISKEQLIALHQQKNYKVYMMGFLPGFAYMGVLDEAIACPRKPTPRAKVEAGSVGIAGNQTGIYPLSSPGGWQIIGQTPLRLFDPEKANPFLLKPGDTVKFYAISKAAFFQTKNIKADSSEILDIADNAAALVIKPGVYATLQDQGRFGFRAFGVPQGGAMDLLAHHTANALVGNAIHAATIECAMGGLIIQFKNERLIALTGGGAAFINQMEVSLYQVHAVYANDILELQFNQQGIRTYIAVQGGFAAETSMNSKSASPMLGIGSALKKNTALFFGNDFSDSTTKATLLAAAAGSKIVRVFQGPEYHWMTAESKRQFYAQNFSLSNRCDRMGYHLQAAPLHIKEPHDMLSSAVTKGSIQLTPNGQLIILMSDCQTTGGYPRVGQIAAADLPLVAQWAPGESVSFARISFAEAEALYLKQQQNIHALFS